MNMVLTMQIDNEQNHLSITYIRNNTYHTLRIILETQFKQLRLGQKEIFVVNDCNVLRNSKKHIDFFTYIKFCGLVMGWLREMEAIGVQCSEKRREKVVTFVGDSLALLMFH